MIDLLWIIWDGAAFDVVQRLMDAGDLPNLASICGGQAVPLAPLAPNCQTPPSLASLFTGASIAEHGVSGFRVPTSFADSRSGFERSGVRRPLLWDEITAAGLCHVPWSGRANVTIQAFEDQREKPGLVELAGGARLELGGRPVVVREREDGRYETYSEETDSRVMLAPSPTLRFAPDPLRFGPGLGTHLAILETAETRLLVHSGLWQMRSEPAELAAAAGVFAGKTLGDAYHTDLLGLRATKGGDGSAEDALLESARLQIESFTSCFEALLGSGLPERLAICYLPTLDELQHELFRWYGEDSKPWDVLRRAYALADRHLARLVPHLRPGARVVVSSDHGAAVLRRNYHPNETLARAGLLRIDEGRKIDFAASQAVYHRAENGSVWVDGPVLDAAEAALLAARDPATGQPPADVRRVPPAERDLFGDLYLSPRTGYECQWRPGPAGAEFTDSPKGGTHVAPTGESTLRGMLATAGIGRLWTPGDRVTLMDVHAAINRLIKR